MHVLSSQPIDPSVRPAGVPGPVRPASRSVLGVVVLAVVLTAVPGCGAPGGTEAGGAPSSVMRIPGFGTPVRDGRFEFTVAAIERDLATVGAVPMARSAQGRFVVVSMTVRNIGAKAGSFCPLSQIVKDVAGRSFDSDANAQLAFGTMASYNNIEPGRAVDVKVVYDLPADATPATIELHDPDTPEGAAGVSVALH